MKFRNILLTATSRTGVVSMKLKIKDPGSAITHFIGCIMAIIAAAPLLIKAAREPGSIYMIAMSIFILSMILLYAASTIYHTVDSTEKVNRRLRKMDHMMIFILIAGSYTPVCLITLEGRTGYLLWQDSDGFLQED